MRIGAWIHGEEGIPIGRQITLAAQCGLQSLRCYEFRYAKKFAPQINKHGLSLLAGMHIDSRELVAGWRSQLRLGELDTYHRLDVPLEAICVGNELRERDDSPGRPPFSARLSFSLACVLNEYRRWLDDHSLRTPLTYAMEGIVFDSQGRFHEWLWPLIDACDVVGINLYPMTAKGWFTFGAFDESRRFLCDERHRHDRLAAYENSLRTILQQLENVHKPLILTETGFPSAVAYHREGERLIIPESDHPRYAEAMREFLGVIKRVDTEYGNPIKALYFYEWRDNLYHRNISDSARPSPIHTAFGLCDRRGAPKMDIKALVEVIA